MTPGEIAAPLIAHMRTETTTRSAPLVIGIDGRSGSGKSTIAAAVRAEVGPASVTVIEGDQFYAGGSPESWDARTVIERAAFVMDWRRQRVVLEQLLAHGVAEWHPFDWDAPNWDREPAPLATTPIRTETASVIILEGAYSCRPELHDLVDLRVLVEVPTIVRRQQLLEREGEEYRSDWEARWSSAEDHYFGEVMLIHRFDLVLSS